MCSHSQLYGNSSNENSTTSFVLLTNHSIARKQLEIETLAFCVLSRMIGKQLVESCPRWMALLHEYWANALGDHPYITSAKGLGGWGQKMALFADVQYCIYEWYSGWVRKSPKICWRNIGMIPRQKSSSSFKHQRTKKTYDNYNNGKNRPQLGKASNVC